MNNISRYHLHRIAASLLGCWCLLLPQAIAQGIPLDTPKAPLIKLIDDHYRHEIGTGFLLELDLDALPPCKGTLVIQAVQTPYQEAVATRERYSRWRAGGNPLVAFSKGVGRIIGMGRPVRLLPLPQQPILPLDSQVGMDANGMMSVGPNAPRQIRFLVPQYEATDSFPIFFVLHDDAQEAPLGYVRSPRLRMDTLLADIDVQLVGTAPGHHLGAQGQWVTLAYQPPPYIMDTSMKMGFLKPRIFLNQQFEASDPATFEGWRSTIGEAGQLTCFVPDALARPDGSIELEMRLHYDANYYLVARQDIQLRGTHAPPRMAIRITSIERKAPRFSAEYSPYVNYSLMLTLGGTRLGGYGRASATLSSHALLLWDANPPIPVPMLPGDSIGLWIAAGEKVPFESTPMLFRYLPLKKLPQAGGAFTLKYRFRGGGMRNRWWIHGECIPLD